MVEASELRTLTSSACNYKPGAIRKEGEKDTRPYFVCEVMKTKSSEMLPKNLPAAVCSQYILCGKPACRCAGGDLHGPYFYCFWREDGKLKKSYVRKADVDRVRDLCQAKRRAGRMLNTNFDLWRSIQLELREVESNVRAK
jgi:hypothetical protein